MKRLVCARALRIVDYRVPIGDNYGFDYRARGIHTHDGEKAPEKLETLF